LMKGNCRKRVNLRWMVLFCLMSAGLAVQAACAGKENEIKKAFSQYPGNHLMYVSKKKFLLDVYTREGVVVASFPIAYGSNPDRLAKIQEGDNRTPEGLYYVTEMLSMDAGKKTDSYIKLRNLNRVYFRASKGHSKFGKPGVDLGDNAYGPRYFGISYPNMKDREHYQQALKNGTIRPQNGKTPGIGFGIAIHGNNDENAIGNLSSNGCIRMFNRDVVACERYVRLGMPVIISED
jgi:murein L,D-transpeptidase YafK